MKKIFVFAVLAVALIATQAMAKEGLYVGASLLTNDISTNGIDSGTGWGLKLGNGFNKYLSVEGNYVTSKHDVTGGGTVDLTGLSVGFKVNFPLTSLDSANVMTVEPYILVGYGQYEANSADGGGSQFGIGVELYLFKELSVNAGWTKSNIGGDFDADVKTIDIGVMYHFI